MIHQGMIEEKKISDSFLNSKGSDLMLLKLAEEVLKQANWPSTVLTGRYTFTPNENQHVLK